MQGLSSVLQSTTLANTNTASRRHWLETLTTAYKHWRDPTIRLQHAYKYFATLQQWVGSVCVGINIVNHNKRVNLCLASVSLWGKQIVYVQYVDYFYTEYMLYSQMGKNKRSWCRLVVHSMEWNSQDDPCWTLINPTFISTCDIVIKLCSVLCTAL